jgi:hypothetical protein
MRMARESIAYDRLASSHQHPLPLVDATSLSLECVECRCQFHPLSIHPAILPSLPGTLESKLTLEDGRRHLHRFDTVEFVRHRTTTRVDIGTSQLRSGRCGRGGTNSGSDSVRHLVDLTRLTSQHPGDVTDLPLLALCEPRPRAQTILRQLTSSPLLREVRTTTSRSQGSPEMKEEGKDTRVRGQADRSSGRRG